MTKKHYEAIARVIRGYMNYDHTAQTAKPMAENLAFEFQQDNPKFNRAKFLEACGIVE